MKHKHYDCIVAWAEGKAIQAKLVDQVEWHDFADPIWNSTEIQYRIKPEPKPDIVRYIVVEATSIALHEFVQIIQSGKHLPPNLCLLFDGKTGELKSAEVI